MVHCTKKCAGIKCSNHEQGNESKYYDTARNYIQRVQSRDGSLLCKALTMSGRECHELLLIAGWAGSVHCARGALESFAEKIFAFKMAVKNHDYLGYCSDVQCGCQKQRWLVCDSILVGRGMFYSISIDPMFGRTT